MLDFIRKDFVWEAVNPIPKGFFELEKGQAVRHTRRSLFGIYHQPNKVYYAQCGQPMDKNIRDYASILDLIILNNLQFLDSMLLQWDCDKPERKKILQEAYDFQHPILKRSKTIKHLQEIADRAKRSSKILTNKFEIC